MHIEAFAFVRDTVQALPPLRRVLEIGSRAINGTVKEIFTDATKGGGRYHGIDLKSGPGVNEVADGETWKLPKGFTLFDAVVCCEVFEHTSKVPEICRNVYENLLRPGGVFIVTCADPKREPHSAEGDGPPKRGEHYEGIHPLGLHMALYLAGFRSILFHPQPRIGDLYALALKRR